MSHHKIVFAVSTLGPSRVHRHENVKSKKRKKENKFEKLKKINFNLGKGRREDETYRGCLDIA